MYKKDIRKRLRNTLNKEERLGRDDSRSETMKTKLKQLEKKKVGETRVRAKIKWNAEGERNTKVFWSL